MSSHRIPSALDDEIVARLTSRPRGVAHDAPIVTGVQPLGLGVERDGFCFVPSRAAHDATPLPLVVLLHDGGRRAADILPPFVPHAERLGVVVLAPDARHRTWDVLLDGWGADVTFIDVALDQLFRSVPIDAARVAAAGFADGANYALSLALANAGVVTHALAFTPGAAIVGERPGTPRCFVSHGSDDPVISPSGARRRLVPQLEALGCEVTVRDFAGEHEIPDAIVAEALAWFVSGD
jgi:phospholipase/carboxylesterase